MSVLPQWEIFSRPLKVSLVPASIAKINDALEAGTILFGIGIHVGEKHLGSCDLCSPAGGSLSRFRLGGQERRM